MTARPERRFILRWAAHIGRTPRELLASVTSDDITEMMAYSNLEPFGPLAEEFRSAQLCATLANVHRDPQSRREPWSVRDFSTALDREMAGLTRGVRALLLDDPAAQASLIKQAVFGVGS